MNSKNSLAGSHLRTYERIFQHPISHNLEWRDVRSLLGRLGETEEEHNGNLKVTRNGQVLVLHPARTKDVAEMDELMSLRHFLERSEASPLNGVEAKIHWLMVIDHREARVFHVEIAGGVPQEILPHDPATHFGQAQDSKEVSRGKEKPDPNSFFEPVAKALAAAGPILIFGTGTGTSSEAEQFRVWSEKHHPKLAERIIGLVAIDEHHLSVPELLVEARDFYGALPLNGTQNDKSYAP